MRIRRSEGRRAKRRREKERFREESGGLSSKRNRRTTRRERIEGRTKTSSGWRRDEFVHLRATAPARLILNVDQATLRGGCGNTDETRARGWGEGTFRALTRQPRLRHDLDAPHDLAGDEARSPGPNDVGSARSRPEITRTGALGLNLISTQSGDDHVPSTDARERDQHVLLRTLKGTIKSYQSINQDQPINQSPSRLCVSARCIIQTVQIPICTRIRGNDRSNASKQRPGKKKRKENHFHVRNPPPRTALF